MSQSKFNILSHPGSFVPFSINRVMKWPISPLGLVDDIVFGHFGHFSTLLLNLTPASLAEAIKEADKIATNMKVVFLVFTLY